MRNLDVTRLATALHLGDDFAIAVNAYEKKDFATAATLFKKLADGDDSEAQFNLAHMILDGHVANQDKKNAFQLLAKAAANGNKDAASEILLLKATMSE